MRRASSTGGVIAAALSLTLGATTVSAAEKWSMATPWPGGPLLERAAKGVARNIEFLTNGEVKIEVFPGGTMGSPLKVTETVRKGVAEIGHNWAGYDWGIDKTTVLFAGWAGGFNAEQMFHWLFEGGGLEMYQEYKLEKFGVHVFPCGMLPREMGMHSRKRLQKIEDFKGLKLRTAGAWAEIVSGMGVSTVILPGAEVYPSLERGVIDAIEWAQLSVNKTYGFEKIAKYLIMPGFHQPYALTECEVNKKAWDRIGERNQKLVQIAGKMTTYKFYQQIGHDDTSAYEFYKKSGNEIIVLDEAVIKKGDELSQAWADKVAAKQGGWFAKVLANQRAYKKAWGNAYKYRDSLPPK